MSGRYVYNVDHLTLACWYANIYQLAEELRLVNNVILGGD